MILSHKIRLDPTVKQTIAFKQAAGVARYTWNWALAECESHYKATKKSCNLNSLKIRWNKEKPTWVKESPKDANQQPFSDLKKAYSRFFSAKSKRPKFKCKHKAKQSFYLSNDKFRFATKRVRLPVIGWVRTREELRFQGRVMSARVSCVADKWYISVTVDTVVEKGKGTEVLGVDLGFKAFATLSTGETFKSPRPLVKALKSLSHLSRKHSRKQKGSKNKERCRKKLAKKHARVAGVRNDFLHKLSTNLVARTKLLVIEDLSVKGMQKLYGRTVADLGLGEFRRQLTYKCQKSDVGLMVVDRWFPSSQICHRCGARKALSLSDRVYECDKCGLVVDRDHNAAINISTAGLAGIYAWGHEGSDYKHTLVVKPSWLNQELNPCSEVDTH
jgi:putative transposase